MYETLLNDKKYLKIIREIESIKFTEDGKWDWEHGLGHAKRVSEYVRLILSQLNCDDRTIELGMISGLLHDLGLVKGIKNDHPVESVKLSQEFLNKLDMTENERKELEDAILNHSSGKNIKTLYSAALTLADKLDSTYHRTINSSIQDRLNKEFQKVKKINIEINESQLIIDYILEDVVDLNILKEWYKAFLIPIVVSKYLNKNLIFKFNGIENSLEFLKIG